LGDTGIDCGETINLIVLWGKLSETGQFSENRFEDNVKEVSKEIG
jgi:hypothetical protein